jgi:hypothetical protein
MVTTPQYALTHVKAYIFEIIELQERALYWMSPKYKAECEKSVANDSLGGSRGLAVAYFVTNIVDDAKTFAEVKKILTDMFSKGPNSPERCYTKRIFPLIEEFYKAMKKVVPVLEYKAHSGTECRGWWRVFAGITGTSRYFCSFDLGRDAYMALTFYEQGAITQKQYNNHITNRTLSMLKSDRFQNENGQPDYNKITEYFYPEYREKELDMRFVNVLKEVA